MRGNLSRTCAVLCGLLILPLFASGKFAYRSVEQVPTERVIQNLEQEVKATPKEGQAHYHLARAHSIAFAQDAMNIGVYKDPKMRVGSDMPRVHREARDPKLGKPSKNAMDHLFASVKSYLKATELEPKEGYHWLGLGWMLEEGIPYSDEIIAPFLPKNAKASKQEWRKRAFDAYERAYSLDIDKALKRNMILMSAEPVSWEAAQSLIRLTEKMPPAPAIKATEESKMATVRAGFAKLKSLPMAITPIVLPLDTPRNLKSLVSTNRTVRFDLKGEGVRRRWTWVQPNTGILVWDPKNTGKIRNGFQLFGGRTWFIFWKNGYQPLAALDDNRDGWLAGKELKGIAIWQDHNSNGVSDAGEVKPVGLWGITRLAAQGAKGSEGVYWNAKGVQRLDGSYLPTYDWIAQSR